MTLRSPTPICNVVRHTSSGAFAYAQLEARNFIGPLFYSKCKSREDELRTLILAIAACAVFGCTLGPVGAAALSRDRGNGDPSLRMFGQNTLRPAHRSRRVFIAAQPAVTVGIAF
jgi:hypothetical protein